MAALAINVFDWVRIGPHNRFHAARFINGSRSFSTGCGIYRPMSRVSLPGSIVSATRPADEDDICRRCRHYYR
jgi:hypothetical protein